MKSNRFVAFALILGASVIALSSCGKSTSLTSVVEPPPALDTTPPSAPTGVHGWYDQAANRDYLSWSLSSSPDVAAYEVFLVPSGGSPSLIATLDQTVDAFALPITAESGIQNFRVRAVDASGNPSSYSSSVPVTRHAWEGITTKDEDGGGKGSIAD